MNFKGSVIKDYIADELVSSKVLIGKRMLVISVGDNSSSMSYLKGIINTAKRFEVDVEHVNFDSTISNEEYASHLEVYNKQDYSGILLLTPLPKHLDITYLGNVLSPSKDVDCLNDLNVGKFYLSSDVDSIGPCTAKAVMQIINKNSIDVTGKKVCVIGASNIVGKPVTKLMLDANATVTVCNVHTKNLKEIVLQSDIVVSCAGVANLVKDDMISENTIIIDVGINFVDGKLCGDVDYDSCIKVTPYITPVPGGVGSVTSTIIFQNMKYLIENS